MSESTPSESASESSAGFTTTTGNCSSIVRCLNDTAPVVYMLTVADPGGGSGVCRAFYYGTFNLYVRPVSCFTYDSSNRPKVNAGGCADHTSQFMWLLTISGGVTNKPIFAVTGNLYNAGFLVAIVTYRDPATGTYDPAPNCLQTFTLTKTSTDSLGYPFPTTCTIQPI